ncbi:MAG: hypothetical protein KF796_15130 [Ramlibacter sp.]|nr:hypothetical protein [Ramlibacter sp.]
MRTWTAWDWIGYSALWVTVVFSAAVEGLKKMASPPEFVSSSWVAFFPLILLIVATSLLIWRAFFGDVSKKGTPFIAWPKPYGPPIIHDKRFVNSEVEIDGRKYVKCTFENCTFKYNGTTAIQLQGCHFMGKMIFSSDNPAVCGAWLLLVGLGAVKPGLDLLDLDPSNHIEPINGG